MSTTFLPMVALDSHDGANCMACGSSSGESLEQAKRLEALDTEFKRTVSALSRDRAVRDGVACDKPRPLDHRRDGGRFSLMEPLPLVRERAVHRMDQNRHLWIGVHEGAVLVLDDDENEIFQHLEQGDRVDDVVRAVAAGKTWSVDAAWNAVGKVISKAATAGLVAGVNGYRGHLPPRPDKFARFHVTKACQLECVHCYAESNPYVDRSNEMDPTVWKRVITEFSGLGGEQVVFTGGEALVYRGCLDLMECCKEHGLFVTLFSNGILIPKYIDRIKRATDRVQISLDGPDVVTNDNIRGAGVFTKATRAIETLRDQGVATSVSMTVLNENWESWKAGFIAFAEKYAGAVEFKVSYGVMQYGRGTSLEDVDVEQTRYTVDEYLAAINGELGPKVTRTKSGCGYGEQLVIGPDGTVYPCHLLDAALCHVNDHPVSEIVALLRSVAGAFDVDHIEGCDTCDIRYLCGGKCRVIEGRRIGTRLITTCTADEKAAKLRNLVRAYGGQLASH